MIDRARRTDFSSVGRASQGSLVLIVAFGVMSVLEYTFNVSMGWLLTPSEYGVLGVCISLYLILVFLVGAGFPPTAAKFLSEGIEPARNFKTCLMANLTLGLVISTGFYFVARNWLGLSDAYTSLILFIALAILVLSAGLPFRYALQGLFRFTRLGLVIIVQIMLQLTVAVVLVLRGAGVLGAILGILSGSLVVLFFSVLFLRDFQFWREKAWGGTSILRFGFAMLLGALFFTLMMNIDILGVKFFARQIVSDELAGYYRSAMVLARIPIVVITAVMGAIFPYISRHSRGEKADMYVNKTLKFAALFVLPLSLSMIVIPRSILGFFFPESYLAGANALRLLAIGTGLISFTYILIQSFQARGKPHLPAVLLLAAFLVQFGLLYWMVPRFDIIGAALSTTSACLIGTVLIFWTYHAVFKLRFQLRAMKIVIALALFAGFIYLFPHSGRPLVAVDLILGGIFYTFILALIKSLTAEDVNVLLSGLPVSGLTTKFQSSLAKSVAFLNNLPIGS